jgi:hypothetical protein
MTVPVLIRIRDSAREPVTSALEVENIPFPSRVLTGVGVLLGCWALAVATIFVPLLHFVLVPGFFFAGPVLGWLAAKNTVVVKSTVITCPKCGKETGIEPRSKGWPVGLRCSHCSTTFSAAQPG